jgi:probable addiction module antidote protein
MPIITKPFDPAKYIDTDESQLELLEDAFASEEAAYIAHALGTVARARNMSKIPQELSMTRAGLYRSPSKKGHPRLTTLLGVAKALGYKISIRTA